MQGSQGSLSKLEYPSALYMDGQSGIEFDVINKKPACIRSVCVGLKTVALVLGMVVLGLSIVFSRLFFR